MCKIAVLPVGSQPHEARRSSGLYRRMHPIVHAPFRKTEAVSGVTLTIWGKARADEASLHCSTGYQSPVIPIVRADAVGRLPIMGRCAAGGTSGPAPHKPWPGCSRPRRRSPHLPGRGRRMMSDGEELDHAEATIYETLQGGLDRLDDLEGDPPQLPTSTPEVTGESSVLDSVVRAAPDARDAPVPDMERRLADVRMQLEDARVREEALTQRLHEVLRLLREQQNSTMAELRAARAELSDRVEEAESKARARSAQRARARERAKAASARAREAEAKARAAERRASAAELRARSAETAATNDRRRAEAMANSRSYRAARALSGLAHPMQTVSELWQRQR
jgi:hypothetical protein